MDESGTVDGRPRLVIRGVMCMTCGDRRVVNWDNDHLLYKDGKVIPCEKCGGEEFEGRYGKAVDAGSQV